MTTERSIHESSARTALMAWASITDDCTIMAMRRTTNPLWRVDTPGGQAFVVKQLPEYPPGVPPVVEFRVLCYLQRRAVPVALPILTDDGTLRATVGDRRWTLVPLITGEPSSHASSSAAETAYAVGAAIGRLDEALADCPWRVESYVDDPVKIIREQLPELPPDVIHVVSPLVDRVSRACMDLPVQLTHGDCNDGNVLVHRARVSGILDLDHLPTGPRVRDLAYYLASRLSSYLVGPARDDHRELITVVSRSVAGYHEVNPLTPHEVRAIVPLILVVEIGGAHWSLNGWQPNPDSFRRSLASIAWITRHVDDLDSAARDILEE